MTETTGNLQGTEPPTIPTPSGRRKWLLRTLIVLVALGGTAGAVVAIQPEPYAHTLVTPEEIVQGLESEISLTVRNDGVLAFDEEVEMLVNGKPMDSAHVRVGRGEEAELVFAVPDTYGPGWQKIELVGVPHEEMKFRVLTPARITATNIKIDPGGVLVGGEVTISVTMSNSGQACGEGTAECFVEGASIGSESCLVEGDRLKKMEFTFTPDKPGDHLVEVGNQEATLRAYDVSRHATGDHIVTNEIVGDAGQLKITNTDPVDCVVVLTAVGDPDDVEMAFYVQAGDSHRVRRIADGTYDTYVTFGTDWCQHYKEFTKPIGYFMSDQPTEFDTQYQRNGYRYPIWTWEFASGLKGDVGEEWKLLEGVDYSSFPKL